MKRTPNHHSSVYHGADGWWHGRVSVGHTEDGRPDRRHVRATSEAAVRKKVRALERARDRGALTRVGTPPTVQAWMTTYLDTIAARSLSPRTLDDYWSKTRNWILPRIGGVRLDRLRPEHLDRIYLAMAEAGKAPSHVLKVHRILSRALEIAMRRGHLARNVAKLVDAPTVRTPEIEPLTGDQARNVLIASTHRANGVRWSVGLALGLRQGEALGLRWALVDLDRRLIHIHWQLQRTTWHHGCSDPHACGARRHKVAPCPPGCTTHTKATRGCPPPCPPGCTRHASTCPQRRGGGLVFGEPKGRSRRVVPMPAELAEALTAHRERQQQAKALAGNVWEDHDLVFCQPNGRPIDPRDDWEEWKSLLRDAGVRDARLHDGRHTTGTLLLEQGVDTRVVQEILGHSDLRVTQVYTHVGSGLAADATARLGSLLWRPTAAAPQTTTETTTETT